MRSGTLYAMSGNSYSHPTQFIELNELLSQFVAQVERILGDNFVGAYLQGSFALGDADMYSDCDFLVLAHTKMRTWPNHWAGHIEGRMSHKATFEAPPVSAGDGCLSIRVTAAAT